MDDHSKIDDKNLGADFIWEFPLRRLYLIFVGILTILSMVGLSIQSDTSESPLWKISADLHVTSITLILLLLGWAPFLLPWLAQISPRIQQFFTGLREGGIEEIEAGVLRIKLSTGNGKAITTYEEKVLDTSKLVSPSKKIAEDLDNIYQDTLKAIEKTGTLTPKEALDRIDRLSAYYNRLRDNMPSSSRRTQLMTNIASIMFSLMPSLENFPVQERISSTDGGQRLAAYKFLEAKPDPDCLELLLSRAMGILEVPFGQFHALLALRRMVSSNAITPDHRDRILGILNWVSGVAYMGRDRRGLMINITELLKRQK